MIKKILLTGQFKEFVENERSAGLILMACTVLSLIVANSYLGPEYLAFWKLYLGPLTVSYWVNDGLMAIFFLLIGLELKRELYKGELSDFKNALLPIVAALGGVILPAGFHFALNAGTPYQAGIGIPMATDIAFALSILALVGKHAPTSLKVFLTALAVIDDLIAIIVIAVFYTSKFSAMYLLISLAVCGVLLILNRMRVANLLPYILLGMVMWTFMFLSGVHATIAGVLLAFTIPFDRIRKDDRSPSYHLEHLLHRPVAFLVLPVFALANTGITIGADAIASLTSSNSVGIFLGLFVGKVIGIAAFSFIAVKTKICRLPRFLQWSHIIGAGFLAGIGFTMSIFITNLAFKGNTALINNSKMAILLTSLISGIVGYLCLIAVAKVKGESDEGDSFSYEDDTISPDRAEV
ncbi:MAG: Na+/H+ antiporter NhaA [Acidobacteria bacterium]|nr:MAG: Na+/H+ antiporter NhaA [Acidobacteriota bacterium]REJ99004.1 MAG: Na+/H+ antiporter NhaA [Acidobacteriota bacterium]REK16276.1 MAG: Na+/H+ antiporter NhaA [Acidobacteriota bacterium]REK43957.1 MAG: Na+/H+ antiporter NhaA [Acidobacteriota bacterium]